MIFSHVILLSLYPNNARFRILFASKCFSCTGRINYHPKREAGSQANLANAKDAKQSQANLAVNVNDNVNVNDTLSLTLSHLVESANESVSVREEASKVFSQNKANENHFHLSDE